jgi:uncharacterized protein involved in exopolysaccharide biosynthesis
MTLIEMKASAYDLLAQIQHLEKQLQEVNQKISEELQKEKNENG